MSSDFADGGGGLALAGEYNTFTGQSYRGVRWSDTDSIPALGNPVNWNVGLIRRGDGLLAVNDGSRSGANFRDLQVRTLITGKVRFSASSTPATSGATCTVGDTAYDSNFLYLCVGANSWKRIALSVF